ESRLHAAGAARLHWLAGVVQPHVASLNEEVRDMEVVGVPENHPPGEQRIERSPVHPLQVMFAHVVGWMRLAREDDLNRAPRAIQDAGESLSVVKEELRPLVAGEAAGKADCQRVGFCERAGCHDSRSADTFFRPALARSLSHEGEEETLKAPADGPQLVVW